MVVRQLSTAGSAAARARPGRTSSFLAPVYGPDDDDSLWTNSGPTGPSWLGAMPIPVHWRLNVSPPVRIHLFTPTPSPLSSTMHIQTTPSPSPDACYPHSRKGGLTFRCRTRKRCCPGTTAAPGPGSENFSGSAPTVFRCYITVPYGRVTSPSAYYPHTVRMQSHRSPKFDHSPELLFEGLW